MNSNLKKILAGILVSTAVVGSVGVVTYCNQAIEGYAAHSSNTAAYASTDITSNITSTPSVVASQSATREITDLNTDTDLPHIYCYEDEDEGEYQVYSPTIQAEIYRQYQEFEGELPPYIMVLSLWISESELDPEAIYYNDDGSVDYGIPQINSSTLIDCEKRGWYDPDINNIDDYRVQIHLGLLILNDLCQQCPGGDWTYYRVIRAYSCGVGGLLAREEAGDYGENDEWIADAHGTWYPGAYGRMRKIESHLTEVEYRAGKIDNAGPGIVN